MKSEYECLIVGGGPAGLAAAIALKKLGIDDLVVLERNARLGGILNQCIHPGFGLERFGSDFTGPEYAKALVLEFREAGAECATGAMVLEISDSRRVRMLSRDDGYSEIRASAVIVATGCRERTRENLEIAGTRPAGVFTAGQAQNLINLGGFRLGERVVIQGSGDIGLIMARRLRIEGYRVDGVLERLPYLSGLIRNKVQCLDHFGIPLRLCTQIREIVGKDRVEGVWIERVDEKQRPMAGTREWLPCDTVLFSVGLIPEVDILKSAGFAPPPGRSVGVNWRFEAVGGAALDGAGCAGKLAGQAGAGVGRAQDRSTGIFICGNALHIHDLADKASVEGELVAGHVARFLRGRGEHGAGWGGGTSAEEAGDEAATAGEGGGGECLPYKPVRVDTRFDEAWFGRLAGSGARVCIVCPRGCVVSESEAGCPRGRAYFEESKRGSFQPLTTTVASHSEGKKARLPVKSIEPVEVGEIPLLKRGLSDAGGATDLSDAGGEPGLSVKLGDREVRFSGCG
jgi:NADPH-dependent 2,4-dienoyl-CoA reductase/sulfur reductase-like enzyme